MSIEDNKKLTIWIMINIFYVFVGSYLFTSGMILHKFFSYGFIPLLLINIIISIYIIKKKYYKKNISYIFILLLIICAIISTIFAVNKKVSLLGYTNRDEGLFLIVYYLSLIFLSSYINKNNKKNIILFILITGFIQCIYSICQIYNLPFVHLSYNPAKVKIETSNGYKYIREIWATGFIKNPNFFGTYMLLCLSYSLGLYINEKIKKNKIILFILSIFFMYALTIINALSCIIGLIVVFIYLTIYSLKNKKIKEIIYILLLITIIPILATFQNKTTILNDLLITKNQSIEIAKGNVDDSYGTKRMYIWKNTIKIIPKHIIHGAGIDNSYYAFDGGHLTYKNGKNTYDKAHNEYLQLLITQGIVALVVYLLLCFKIIYEKTKIILKDKEIYIILPTIGYLTQALFNISVIEVAPLFFISLGMCIINKNNYKLLDKSK